MVTSTTKKTCEGDCDIYFGTCPIGHHECKVVNRNVGRDHWFSCDKHKVRWWVGSNLFSHWREESEDDWNRNAEHLMGLKEADPHDCDYCHEKYQAERAAAKSIIPDDDIPF